jgi:hypothetical protein
MHFTHNLSLSYFFFAFLSFIGLAWLGLACALVSSSFWSFSYPFQFLQKMQLLPLILLLSLSLVIKQYSVIKYKIKELEHNKA